MAKTSIIQSGTNSNCGKGISAIISISPQFQKGKQMEELCKG